MAKRFTDTNKWRKPFIRGLEGAYKLFWFYILDDCDHAGIWIVDMDVAEIRTGEKLTQMKAIELFGSHITIFDSGERWFIQDFIDFQYGELNESNRAHKSVLTQLKRYNLLDEISSLEAPYDGAKEKEKEKEKDIKGSVRGKCIMRNSGITLADVKDAFLKTDDIKNADAGYYFNAALDWSDSGGNMRTDWIATVRGFARRDLKDGKMKVSIHKQNQGTNISKESVTKDYGVPSPTAVPMPDRLKKTILNIGKPN